MKIFNFSQKKGCSMNAAYFYIQISPSTAKYNPCDSDNLNRSLIIPIPSFHLSILQLSLPQAYPSIYLDIYSINLFPPLAGFPECIPFSICISLFSIPRCAPDVPQMCPHPYFSYLDSQSGLPLGLGTSRGPEFTFFL